MRRITYVGIAMAFSSVLCIFSGKMSAVIFISPIFSLLFTAIRNKHINSIIMLAFSLSFFFSLMLQIYSEILLSAIIGESTYLLMEYLNRNRDMSLTPPEFRTIIRERWILGISTGITIASILCL